MPSTSENSLQAPEPAPVPAERPDLTTTTLAAPGLREQIRDNGLRWVAYVWLDVKVRAFSQFLQRRMRKLEAKHNLPGVNTAYNNRRSWNSYDWSREGEEWTLGSKWRQALIDEILLAEMPPNPDTLEIGPGGGRWTTVLQERSTKLHLVDVAERPLEVCREKFAHCNNIEYHLSDGSGVGAVPDTSVDFVWSFDVFVHIAPDDQAGYLRDLDRVMRPGARAVIHHAGSGGLQGGWRSGMTSNRFDELLDENGFRLIARRERWGDDSQYKLPVEGDVISIFERIPDSRSS